MKLSIFLIFIFLPLDLFAQDLQITLGASTAGFSSDQFLFVSDHPKSNQYAVQNTGSAFTFVQSRRAEQNFHMYSISPQKRYVSFLKPDGNTFRVDLYEAGGIRVSTFKTDILANQDPNIAIYTLDNGITVIRNDVAFFDFYSFTGQKIRTVSAAVGTSGGEGLANLLISKDGSALFFINPLVKYQNANGSRALVFSGYHKPETVFYSFDKTIGRFFCSDDGSILMLHITDGLQSHQAVLVNAKGDELRRINLDQEPLELSLSSNNRFLVVRYAGRVVVYNIRNGERVGASSMRQSTLAAGYFPADQSIVVLTGDVYGTTIHNPNVHVINLSSRSIWRSEVPANLGMMSGNPFEISTLRSKVYVIRGASQNLVINAGG